MAELYLALIHHPVLDRGGRTVTAAITSLDIHDLARSAHTFGAHAMFVVHQVEEQRKFAERVLNHWREGHGRQHDSRRREALELVRVVNELDAAIAAIEREAGQRPLLVFTSASAREAMSYDEARAHLARGDAAPLLLMFGTGFGMAPEMAQRADMTLAAIRGPGDYNHLSVRAAASIVLDRLRGQ